MYVADELTPPPDAMPQMSTHSKAQRSVVDFLGKDRFSMISERTWRWSEEHTHELLTEDWSMI